MKLLKAKISSFRSVAETTLSVDAKVTILVGPNEGGKTNVLRALESFGPDKEFVDTAVCQFSPAYDQGQSPEIQLLFGDFSANEAAMLTQVLEAEQSRLGNLQSGEEHGSEEAIAENLADDTQVAELAESEDLPHIFLPVVPGSPRFSRLTVTRQGNDLQDFVVHFDDRVVFFPDTVQEHEFKSKFLDSLPRFLYFADVNLLRGEIQLDQLLSDDPEYEAERNLLRLGGIADLETLAGDPHRRDVALKNAEQRVTERLRKYWTQDPSRQFHIDIDKETVRIRISDATRVFDFPESRSLGSRWFISFYINFAARIEGREENAILLFDEPGIHVHPRGQRDLLPFFEELAQKYQIVYTTHLPFLINRNFPARIRVVEKSGPTGTQIKNKPHQNRWKAIRSSVGLMAADSFIVGDACLVVEGVSDHVYLSGLSAYLAQLEIPHLDLNEVAVIPGGSASDTIPIARFCQAEKIPVVVLLDSDNQGDQAKEQLLKDRFIEERQVMRVDNCSDDKAAGVVALEDILPLDQLVCALNSAYKDLVKGFSPLTAKEVSDARSALHPQAPITSAVDNIFKDKGYGKLDKRLVAECFVNSLPNPEGLSADERQNLVVGFENIGKLFAIAHAKLKTLSEELK
jgi:predicted ATP-dependent endonuclease of OLD family